MRIFISAGEPSGDLLGGRLMASLKKKSQTPLEFKGIGGEKMIAEGLNPLFPMSEITLMGIFEVLPKIPKLLYLIHKTRQAILDFKPDAVITIDAPDFNFRVVKPLKGMGFPLIHYVAPSVWVWREGRAKKIAKFLDHLLTLLPFEPPYFIKHGLDATFVGHPIIETEATLGDAKRFRKNYNIPHKDPILVMLPGSRRGEIKRLLNIFIEIAHRLKKANPKLWFVIPGAPSIYALLQDKINLWPDNTILFSGDDQKKYDAFAAGTVALAASGTVSLELNLAQLPTIICYKVSPLTALLARFLLNVKYISLVNILANKAILPEYIQHFCTADLITPALQEFLDYPEKRDQQKKDVAELRSWLQACDTLPSERAAEIVFKKLKSQRPLIV